MAEGKKFYDVVLYFKQLAAKHKLLRQCYRFELDEVLTSLRDIETPCLVLEGYKFSFSDNKSDNILKTRSGAFILLEHVKDIGDYNLIHNTWDTLEEIGDDILARIKADKNNPGSPVRNFPVENVEGHLLSTEMGNYYGIRFTFDIECKFNAEVDPDRWNPIVPVL